MPTQSNNNTPQPEENTKRQERANRILDAASELVQRWGYKKTTIDDIARQARVAKGTIYLHWKTREELFLALLTRERSITGKALVEQIANDPDGSSLHGLMKHVTRAALTNPLIKALMLRDTDVLGDLAHSELGRRDAEQRMLTAKNLLEQLRGKGLLHTNMSLDAQLYMLSAISTGFIMIDQFLPEEFHVSPEAVAEMVSETVLRTFEARQPTPDEQQEALDNYQQAVDAIRERYQKDLEE